MNHYLIWKVLTTGRWSLMLPCHMAMDGTFVYNLYEAFVLWLIVKLLQSDLKGFLTDLHNIHPMFKWNCRIADG